MHALTESQSRASRAHYARLRARRIAAAPRRDELDEMLEGGTVSVRKSYVFAKPNESVSAHMRGLQEVLRRCIENEQANASKHGVSMREYDYTWAKIRAYESVIDIIEKSRSVD